MEEVNDRNQSEFIDLHATIIIAYKFLLMSQHTSSTI